MSQFQLTSKRSVTRAVYGINASMVAFVVGDTVIKFLAQTYPASEVIFFRSCLIIGAFAAVLIAKRKSISKKLFSAPVFMRCAFDCINIFSFVTVVVHLNLAELYAILLTSPFLTTIFAVLLFKETVGWRRWLAIAFGFVGALLIIKPDTHAFSYWAAVGLIAALAAALRDLATTKIDPEVSTLEATLLSAIFVGFASAIFGSDGSWTMMTPHEAALLVAVTIAWTTGGLFLVYACREGPIFIVASFKYTMLVWGGLVGYFVFGDIPDIWSVIGAVVIVLCGLYIFYREAVHHHAITSRVPVR